MNYTDIFNARGDSYNQAHMLFPSARHIERQLLLNLLDLKPKDIVIDAPAGGGFVSEALQEHVMKTICIEPSPEFARSIPISWQTHCEPIYKTTLATASATKYASLAGLHHLSPEDMKATFAEAYRLLQPAGIIAVADVKTCTKQAQFLNGPVDRYTDTGHQGKYFETGKLSEYLRDAEFSNVQEQHHEFDWIFDTQDQMFAFVKMLFGMTKATLDQVAEAINEYLSPHVQIHKATLTWGLTYASGAK
jgi:cyclopropane fatty-acyl-phospholipid synthase-like methyltransferase